MTSTLSRTAGPRWLLVTIALATATGCGGSRHSPATGQERATLDFTNESLDKAEVYAVVPGQSVRIGTVFAGRTERLVVPGDIAFRGSSVNVVARLLARSYQPQTGPISLRPGDHLSVTLPINSRALVVLPGNP